MQFFVIKTTLTCITQMIIWLVENACIYMYMHLRSKTSRILYSFSVSNLSNNDTVITSAACILPTNATH